MWKTSLCWSLSTAAIFFCLCSSYVMSLADNATVHVWEKRMKENDRYCKFTAASYTVGN